MMGLETLRVLQRALTWVATMRSQTFGTKVVMHRWLHDMLIESPSAMGLTRAGKRAACIFFLVSAERRGLGVSI